MKQKLYIDKGKPFVTCWPEKLSDGSIVWQISFRGGETIDAVSEKAADAAFVAIGVGIEHAIGRDVLIV